MAYPTTLDTFSTKATGNVIDASHVNDLQTAVVAIETKLGITGSGVTTTADYKLSEVTGADVAVGKSATQTLTGKTLTNPTLTTPTIASFTNANHDHTNSAGGGVLSESSFTLSDNTTNDVTTSKHGFVPKAPNDTAKFLRGDGTWASAAATTNQGTYTAGENISQGNPVYVSDGEINTSVTSTSSASTYSLSATSDWFSQKISIPAGTWTGITRITLGVGHANVGTQSYTWTVSIRANSGGAPTGADLGSTSGATVGTTNTLETITVDFASPVAVSGSTDYHIVMRVSSVNGSLPPVVYGNTTGSTGANKSINSGSSWSANNGPLYHTVYLAATVAGRIYKTSAATSGKYQNFIGFAAAAITSGNTGQVDVSGTISYLSGLTTGQQYLGDTAGTIQSTAGSNSRKVGIATSATSLVITNIW